MSLTEIATPELIFPSELILLLLNLRVGDDEPVIDPEFIKSPPEIVNVLFAFSWTVLFALIVNPPLKVASFVSILKYPVLPAPSVNIPEDVVVNDENSTT